MNVLFYEQLPMLCCHSNNYVFSVVLPIIIKAGAQSHNSKQERHSINNPLAYHQSSAIVAIVAAGRRHVASPGRLL